MKQQTIWVAVYGTLMSGERNYRWGASAKQRIPATLTGTLYDTGFGFPAFVPTGNTIVTAELLEVTPELLAHMDMLEGYPRLYRRETVTATTSAGEKEALVYVMNHLPMTATEIVSGDWRKYRENYQ